jgi:hypothetical protein
MDSGSPRAEQDDRVTAMRRSKEVHGQAESKARAPKVRVVDGRVVGKSIADPDVQKKLLGAHGQTRAGLTKFYVEQGILTPKGKLSKRFGGG